MIAELMAAAWLAAGGATSSGPCPRADEAMLGLSLEDFDQGDAGWRSLDGEGCEAAAADAISEYRRRNGSPPGDDSTLVWHEAQLRAAAGQTDEAITLMLESRASDGPEIRPYTDATIAFLRRDRAALEAARDALAALPEPEAFRRAAELYAAAYPDLPALVWPLNLDVVDGLIACFDQPYREAYGCRPGAPDQGAPARVRP